MSTYQVAGRTVRVHDREEWQSSSQPVTGPAPYPELVHHFVVHWPGAPATWKPPSDVAAHLREGQADYLANKGYSYGYGFVIGPNPVNWDADPIVFDTWEVRGFDIRIASNNGDWHGYEEYDDPNFNGRSISAQLMASESYPATDDQILQARYMVSIADNVYGETLTVIPHCESDQTDCPGDYLRSQIDEIATRPTTHPPEPEPEPEPEPPSTIYGGNMLFISRLDSNPNLIVVGDGINSRRIRADEVDELTKALSQGTGPEYHDPTQASRPVCRDINKLPKISDDWQQVLGLETTESLNQPG